MLPLSHLILMGPLNDLGDVCVFTVSELCLANGHYRNKARQNLGAQKGEDFAPPLVLLRYHHRTDIGMYDSLAPYD